MAVVREDNDLDAFAQATSAALDSWRSDGGSRPRQLSAGLDRRPLLGRLLAIEGQVGYRRGQRGHRWWPDFDATRWFADDGLTAYPTVLVDVALGQPTASALDEMARSIASSWRAAWAYHQPDTPYIHDITGDLVALRALGALYLPPALAEHWAARMEALGARWECHLAHDPGPDANVAIATARYTNLPPFATPPRWPLPGPSGSASEQVARMNVDRWRSTRGPITVVVPPQLDWPDDTTARDRALETIGRDWSGEEALRHFADVTLPELAGQLLRQATDKYTMPDVLNRVADAIDDVWNAVLEHLEDPAVGRAIVGELAALRALGALNIQTLDAAHWARRMETTARCYGELLAPDPGADGNAEIVAARYLILEA